MSCGPACIPGSLSLGAVTGPLPLSALAAVSRSAPHSPAPGRAAPRHGTPVVLSCSQDGRVEVVQSGGPASLASSRATLANQVKQPTRSCVVQMSLCCWCRASSSGSSASLGSCNYERGNKGLYRATLPQPKLWRALRSNTKPTTNQPPATTQPTTLWTNITLSPRPPPWRTSPGGGHLISEAYQAVHYQRASPASSTKKAFQLQSSDRPVHNTLQLLTVLYTTISRKCK